MMPTHEMVCLRGIFGGEEGGRVSGASLDEARPFLENRREGEETTAASHATKLTHKSAVQASDAVRRQGLAVHVHQPVELALPALLGRLGVVGQARTGIVERVDERQGGGARGTTGSHVAGEPLPVAVAVLVVAEHLLELVLEGEVERLRGEVADDVGGVAAPQSADALVAHGAAEAVADALVGLGEAALLDHLVLVLWCFFGGEGFVGERATAIGGAG